MTHRHPDEGSPSPASEPRKDDRLSEAVLCCATFSLVYLDGRFLRNLKEPERAEAIQHLIGHRPWFEHQPMRRQLEIIERSSNHRLGSGPLFNLLNSQTDLKTWRLRVTTPFGVYDYTTAFVGSTVHLQLVTDVERGTGDGCEADSKTTNVVDLLKPLATVTMGGGGPSGPHSGAGSCPPLDLGRLASEVTRRAHLHTYAGGTTSCEQEIAKVRHALSGLTIRGPGLSLADFAFLAFEETDFGRASTTLCNAVNRSWPRPYAVCVFIAEDVRDDGEIITNGPNGTWQVHAYHLKKSGKTGPYLIVGVADRESLSRRSMVAVVARGIVSRDWWAPALSRYERIALGWAQPMVETARRKGLKVTMRIGGKVSLTAGNVYPDLTFEVFGIDARLLVEILGLDEDNSLDPDYRPRKQCQEKLAIYPNRYHPFDAAEAEANQTWLTECVSLSRAFDSWALLIRSILAIRRRK